MPLLVGIDEAGYGPLLGPLVVGATVWRVPPRCLRADFWKLLHPWVCRRGRGGWRLAVADSKAVFDRQRGLHTLERPVLAFAHAAGMRHETLHAFLKALGAAAELTRTRMPWYGAPDRPLPSDPARSSFETIARRLGAAMPAAGLSCCGMMAQLVCEDGFNRRLGATRNKAAVLVEAVLSLLQRAGTRAADEDLYVRVDRLGGRSDYRALLLTAFPARHLHICEQTGRRSRYRLAGPRNDWHIEFAVDADRSDFCVALASMLAKYLRELIMERFNAYWRQWLPQLRPTAGYYRDARRFVAQIAPLAARTGLPAARFVRGR